MDIKLDANMNIVVGSTGKTALTAKGAPQAAQRLAFRLHIFKGELLFAQNRGIPYLQELLGKVPSDQTIDQVFRSYVLEDPEFSQVTALTVTRKPNRVAAIELQATHVSAQTVRIVLPNILDPGQVTLDGIGLYLDGVPVVFDAGVEPSDILTLDGRVLTLGDEPLTIGP